VKCRRRGTTRAQIRIWKNNVLVLSERREIPDDGEGMENLAHKHVLELGLLDAPHMVEFEFLDEPNVLERFARFGTDGRRMDNPIAVDLTRFK
jgi:hypothetical protein